MSIVSRLGFRAISTLALMVLSIPGSALAKKTVFLREPKIQVDVSPRYKESIQQEINGRIKSAISKMALDTQWQIKNALVNSQQVSISGDISASDYVFNVTVVATDFIYDTHRNAQGQMATDRYPYFKMDAFYEVTNNKTSVILANKQYFNNGKSILADQSLPNLFRSYSQSFGTQVAQVIDGLPEPARTLSQTPTTPSVSNSPKKVYALLFGVSNYKDSQISFPNAHPSEDVKAMENFIKSYHGYDDFNIETKLDSDASRTGILQPINDLKYKATEQDTVIVYFSGHGGVELGEENNMFIVPYDFDRRLPGDKGIYSEEMKKQLKLIKAKNIFLVLDACHSGAFIDNGLVQINRGEFKSAGLAPPQVRLSTSPIVTTTKQPSSSGGYQGPAMYILTSSGSSQLSSLGREHNQSDFTYHLLQGMSGAADSNKDGRVMASELVNFVTQEMQREGNPQVSFPSPNTGNLSILDRRPDKKYHLYLDPVVNWLTPSQPSH